MKKLLSIIFLLALLTTTGSSQYTEVRVSSNQTVVNYFEQMSGFYMTLADVFMFSGDYEISAYFRGRQHALEEAANYLRYIDSTQVSNRPAIGGNN